MASTSTSDRSIPPLENEIICSQRNSSVYEFYNHQPDPGMVLIFFHDLHLNKEERPHVISWMSRSEPSVCWPQKWLPKEYPKSQILSILYDSSILKTETAGHMDLFQIGENLWQDILPECAMNCPIFLVGHGAGGLVIKALILAMRGAMIDETLNKTSQAKAGSFLNNVKGIFYYSTPNHGLNLANCITCLPTCLFSPLLDPLQVLSTQACRLNFLFAKWRKGTKCRTATIFAAGLTRVALCWYTHIVTESSARPDSDTFYTVESDHFNACKPYCENHSSFQRLVDFIAQEITALSMREEEPTISSAPPLTEDCAETACQKLVANILNGCDLRHGLWLQRENAIQIETFPEVWDSLTDGLQKAGLEFAYDDGIKYKWRRKCARVYGGEPGRAAQSLKNDWKWSPQICQNPCHSFDNQHCHAACSEN